MNARSKKQFILQLISVYLNILILCELCRPLIRYGGQNGVQSCMSVRFNAQGSQVLALRRRFPPILYNTFAEDSICQFYHSDYYNSCTMKSCSFAGDNDEYVLSGSDDFNLYIWRVADADCKFTKLICQIRYRKPKKQKKQKNTNAFSQVTKRINGLTHIIWFCTAIVRL